MIRTNVCVANFARTNTSVAKMVQNNASVASLTRTDNIAAIFEEPSPLWQGVEWK